MWKAHPNVAVDRVDAECGEDRMKSRRIGSFLLPIDLFARGSAFGPCIEAGELKIDAGIAETVVLADAAAPGR